MVSKQPGQRNVSSHLLAMRAHRSPPLPAYQNPSTISISSSLSPSTSTSTLKSRSRSPHPHTHTQSNVHLSSHTHRKNKTQTHHFTILHPSLKIPKRRNRNGKNNNNYSSPPPNVPLIMSQAALNAESGMRLRGLIEDLGLGMGLGKEVGEGEDKDEGASVDVEEYLEGVQMGHVDEFVALFFGLGLLRSDTPQPLASTPSETDINHLARIFHTWLSTTTNLPTSSILLAKSHGHILGSQLLATCLNKGVSAKSLYHLVQDTATFYSEYCQDLEDEAGKGGWERDGFGEEGREGRRKGMGKVLKLVLGRDRVGIDVPGWEALIRNATGMFALLQGASEEIGEMLRMAGERGIS